MNKASGGDGIPAELFKIIKYDAVKVLQNGRAIHSGVLGWIIPRMEGPGGLMSMGLHTVTHN